MAPKLIAPRRSCRELGRAPAIMTAPESDGHQLHDHELEPHPSGQCVKLWSATGCARRTVPGVLVPSVFVFAAARCRPRGRVGSDAGLFCSPDREARLEWRRADARTVSVIPARLLQALSIRRPGSSSRLETRRRSIEIPWDAEALETRYQAAACSSDDPEKLFDRQWALTLIEHARARLRAEYANDAKTRDFEVLLPYLTQHGEKGSQELAAALGTTEGAARVTLHRFKRRFGSALRVEVASTVGDPEQVESELRFLLQALGGPSRTAPKV